MSSPATFDQTKVDGLPLWALVSAIAFAWIMPGLLGHDPWKPDEAYTFGLVYHILQSGDWVVPQLADEPFVEKPPLFYLSAALFAKALAWALPLHDAARMATGFYMALTFLFVALTGRELYGKGRGWISVIVMVGCFGLLVRAHQLITDIALLAGCAIALYGLALSLRRPLLAGFALGTGAGIAFMAKGLLGPGMFALIALALPAAFPAWRSRSYLGVLGVGFASILPWISLWPWLLYQSFPTLFHEWLWDNNFGRFFGTNRLGPSADAVHYLLILPWYAFPALPLALWVLWQARTTGFGKAEIQLPLVTFIVMFAVLSLSANARELYAMPMLLPLALLATPAIGGLRRGAANALYWFSIMGFTFFAGVIWFYWVALEFGVPARLSEHLNALQPGYDAGFRALPFALAALYTAGWFALLAHLKRRPERPVVAWSAGITLVWALIMTLLVGWLDTGKSYRSMVAELARALPKNVRCITSRALGEPQRAMLQYYAGIITAREELVGANYDCNLLLIQGDAETEPQVPPRWRKIWEGNRPGDAVERYRLYRRGR